MKRNERRESEENIMNKKEDLDLNVLTVPLFYDYNAKVAKTLKTIAHNEN